MGWLIQIIHNIVPFHIVLAKYKSTSHQIEKDLLGKIAFKNVFVFKKILMLMLELNVSLKTFIQLLHNNGFISETCDPL